MLMARRSDLEKEDVKTIIHQLKTEFVMAMNDQTRKRKRDAETSSREIEEMKKEIESFKRETKRIVREFKKRYEERIRILELTVARDSLKRKEEENTKE